MSTIDTINDMTISCSRELFDACGVPLDADKLLPGGERHDLASVIGFTGTEMKGTLILTSTSGCVRRAHPRGSEAALSDADLRDWMGELANQLLGRIKSSLLRHQVVLIMSTPVALSGDQLQWAKPSSPTSTRHYLRGEAGGVTVCFDAVIAQGFELAEAPSEPVGASTGDLLFF